MREEVAAERMSVAERKADPASWIIAIVSGLALCGLFVLGRGGLLRIGIPAAATCIALSVYFRKPSAYLEFALWTWLLTPFIRRVVDWRVGFADPNLTLLTPFLVSFVAILDLRVRKLVENVRIAPFVFCAVGVAYGFLVGMVIHPSTEVIYGLVNWLSPMLLGLHIYLNWEEIETHTAVIQRVALYGLLFIGTYGIYQFYKPPAWDAMWLKNLPGGLASSTFGRPEPQQIRVWSTLNAPGPFADVALALLFFVVPKRSRLKLLALAVGFYAVMLSLVRTAWVTGAAGTLYLARSSNKRLFFTVVVAMGVGCIGLVALANSPLNIPMLQDRLKTLGDLKNDESVQDRTRLYTGLSQELLTVPVGIGLNNADFYHGYPLDSGPIRMLLNLGWFGTIIYSVGIARILLLMRPRTGGNDLTAVSAYAIVLSFIFQMLSGLIFISSTGAMFWVAAGLGLACATKRAELRVPEYSSAAIAPFFTSQKPEHGAVLSSLEAD